VGEGLGRSCGCEMAGGPPAVEGESSLEDITAHIDWYP